VAELEVLIGKFLAVDGATSSAVVAGKVTTLKHKVWNDTVEDGSLVVFAFGTTLSDDLEVLGRLWDYIVVEGEVDATLLRFGLTLLCDAASLVNLDDWASPFDIEEALCAGHFWFGGVRTS